ncbi:MAG: nucleotide sugar dehydrogenase [Acidobacteriota bacterium]|nr:nucleotide sugar dehydrogenase [Acidobacteriota bacterium]
MTTLTEQKGTAEELLLERIETKKARTGVIGLGYVGLPLAVEYGKAGFEVTGFDVDPSRTEHLNLSRSHVLDVPSAELAAVVAAHKFRATTDFSRLADMDTVNICVPTPLRKSKDPDMSYIQAACEQLARYIHPGMLVILESTTYPGTTDEMVLPMLSASGLKVGEDFFLCFSPERVDPGNPAYQTKNIPKVVGGVTPACTRAAAAFYGKVLDKVVPVSGTRVAEMVKLLENTFRMINIGLVNELAMMCDRLDIDVWEVIDAASTKPFGFMPFYPGPGLGGHCIPIDPFYLSWKTRQSGIEARFIELAGYINGSMPHFVVEKVQRALNEQTKPLKGSSVHILGVAYKKNIPDTRESPSLDIMHLLEKNGATVSYSDPYVDVIETGGRVLCSKPVLEAVAAADCTVIVTDHDAFDYASIVGNAKLVVDTRNALRGIHNPNIVRL